MENKKLMLKELMSHFTDTTKGTMGDYKNMEVVFEIIKDATPYHVKPYRIPAAQITLMKRIIEVKALAEYRDNSPWVAPTFGVPKKDDRVRIETSFCKLNEPIKRNI